MAENINISFTPNKSADNEKRLNDIENFISLLADRIKFCLADINDDVAAKSDGEEEKKLIYQALSDGVGEFTNADKNSEIFNDYSGNTAYGKYSHVEGYKNRMDSEGAILSWATHIEGYENTEASRTSCPSDKKASNNHIEGRMNNSYGRVNHVEGVNCFAKYDTQCCHVEGSGSRVSEGARVAHVEGKDCVAGGNCTHAQNLGTIAEKDNCTALGKYNKDFDYAVMIGGGSSDTDRKNILTVEWDGTVRNTGSVYTDGDVMGKNVVFDGNLSVLGNVNFYGKTNFKVPIATRNAVGGIKIGNNLSIAADGTLSAEAQPDIASASKAGIVKVGENIDVTADGTISIPAPCTLRIDNKASANLVHKYVPVTTSEEKIYYGDISNSIVCNGYTFWGSGMTIADPGVFLDFSPTLMVEKFAKTASGEIIEDCDFQVALVNVDSKAFKSYRLESKKAELTTTSVYKNYSVQFDPIIFPTWKSIIAPTNNHPYGRLQVTLSLMYVNSSNKVATGNSINGYIDFATEAEYNAAVCLTHSSVRTTRMEERTNAFIIPSSLSLVTDALPETGEEDVLYLIYDEDTAPAMKEYLWHNGAWRYLGTTDVDLSEYLKSTDISDWAKAATKPTYTAKEVGAAAEQHKHSTADITDFPAIPTKVSELQNDSGYISEETDPTVPAWAKAESKPAYTAEEVGAAAQAHTHTKSQITDFPESLPANGGNADTVDGKHASDFAAARHTHTATEVGAAAKSHTHTKSQITDFPESLPANGGNADTVDGKHASDFAADITAAVNAVSIGGRNIATGTATMTLGANNSSNWNTGTWQNNRTYGELSVVDITDSPVEGITKAFRLVNHDVPRGFGIVQNYTPLVAGQQYVLSCWIRGTASLAQLEVYYDTNIRGGVTTVSVTPQWQHVYATCGNTDKNNVPPETKPYPASYVYLVPRNVGEYIEICGLKLEKGNKPTDWTPAPEDDERRIASLEARVAALEAAAVSGGEV